MNLEGIKILLVDDEEDILEFMTYVLKKEGAHVYSAKNGNDGFKLALQVLPHLIILDRMMPILDGVETCKLLRSNPLFNKTIILFLSALGDVENQITGLSIGANDYISKPIKMELLLLKIKSHLKAIESDKSNSSSGDSIIEIGDIRINRNNFEVRVNDSLKVLPKKEFELLYLLMSNPHKLHTRQEILSTIWGKDLHIGNRTIDVHIRKIREKIGNNTIYTVKGIGYKFTV